MEEVKEQLGNLKVAKALGPVNMHPRVLRVVSEQEEFDKVPHWRLLAKVRACGVAGSVANWIAN